MASSAGTEAPLVYGEVPNISDMPPDPEEEAFFKDEDDLKHDFRISLDTFETDAKFYAQGVLGDGNPGLSLNGLGQFGMPLSEPEVLRIITACKQAPSAKAVRP